MYSIARLAPRQQDFLTGLAQRNLNRSVPVSIALAKVLSAQVPVPSSPVESVDTFFNEQGCGVILSVLDAISTVVPVNHALIHDIGKSFFRFAYDTVHGGLGYEEGRMYTSGVVSFFRIDKHFSEEIIKTIESEYGSIESMIREFTIIVEDMRKAP